MMFSGIGMGLGLLAMIIIWGGLIALGVWLVRGLFPGIGQPPPAAGHDLSAREILDRRFARGEIGPEEYELMKHVIADGAE
jgi:uncharacterized membrane protein